jgi:hypothetical protein
MSDVHATLERTPDDAAGALGLLRLARKCITWSWVKLDGTVEEYEAVIADDRENADAIHRTIIRLQAVRAEPAGSC